MIDSWFSMIDDIPVVSKEARNIKCLYDIIIRDKVGLTAIGGKQARVKVRARKELAFIYFYLKSDEFSNYEGKDRINVIRKRLDIDFELDKLVWDAINELKEDLVTIEEKLLKNFTDTLSGYATFLGKISANIRDSIEYLEQPRETLTLEDISRADALLEKAKLDFKWMLDAGNQLKTTFKNVEDLRTVKNVKGRKRTSDKLQSDASLYRRREDVQ